MIKLQHTVFALPFAIISLITAADEAWPAPATWMWVLVAMVGARTAAMSFNRLADQEIDAANPRTQSRALPAGRLKRSFVIVVTVVSCAVFIVAAAFLNRLCLILAVPTLLVLLGYSFAKRFTSLSHLWLGCALGLAPIGAWVAVTGRIDWPPLVLGGAVLFWVAGFDVVYSLQDHDFDRESGLKSLPSVVGPRIALRLASLFHGAAFFGFGAFAVLAGGGVLRLSAVVLAGLLLGWQHRLVSVEDLSRVNAAFFSANGFLALVMCLLFMFAKMPFAL
jgi:4-hydroxybenzoate polyprenyltransferase